MKLGLLGKDISYSLSPLLHKTILDKLGLPFDYRIFDGDFDYVMEQAKNLNGFNVTIPYKEEILSKLHEISPEAKKIGAVNTVTVAGEGLTGYNTDFLALQEIFSTFELKGQKVLILGCGGVAKAFCHLLQDSHVTISVRNLSSPRLASLKEAFENVAVEQISEICQKFDIVINATSEKGKLVSLAKLSPNFVFDVIYSEETALLKEARLLEINHENGLRMLFLQGVFAQELFLNRTFSKSFLDECFESFKNSLQKINHLKDSQKKYEPFEKTTKIDQDIRENLQKIENHKGNNKRDEKTEKLNQPLDNSNYPCQNSSVVTFEKSELKGEFYAPTSKSQLHRILFVAFLKKQRISVSFQMSNDILETIEVLKTLGTTFEIEENESFHSLKILSFASLAPKTLLKLHVQESGTTSRLTLGVLATLENPFELTLGNALKDRPHHFIAAFGNMKKMVKEGNKIFGRQGRTAETTLAVDPAHSTQFVTSSLLALSGGGTLHLKNPRESGYIDMTIDILKKFGTSVEKCDCDYVLTYQKPCPNTQNNDIVKIEVEGDFSQASYFLLEKRVTCENLNPSSKQGDKKILEILQAFPNQNVFDCSEILDLVPTLVALSLREGKKIKLLGLANLAWKETNRLETITKNLEKNNAPFVVSGDSLEVFGQTETCNFDSYDDHRIAMAFAMVAVKFGGSVQGFDAWNKSYPNFLHDLKKLGGKLKK